MCCNTANGSVDFEDSWLKQSSLITKDEHEACELTRTKVKHKKRKREVCGHATLLKATCKERSVDSPPQIIFSSSVGLWSWSTIHPQSVYSLGADIYVNYSQSPPSHLQDYSAWNRVRWLILFPWFDPNEWCMKNGLLSGGLNPGPLDHESSVIPLSIQFSL